MPIDYGALLYDPVYAELGVPATMRLNAPGRSSRIPTTAGDTGIDITVIDDTRPKILPIVTGAQTAEVRNVGPGAFARIYELAQKGIARADYADAILGFNGRSWIVRSWELRGSPMGEDWGEVRFLLKEAP
jgi:hypothetical protein